MATKFKTVFEVAEERAFEKGMEKSLAIGKKVIYKTIEVLIKNSALTDVQIANELEEPISLVEKIRKELNSTELK